MRPGNSPLEFFKLFLNLGLTFPKIRNKNENYNLINFLRISIFEKSVWTDSYANSHNVSLFGKNIKTVHKTDMLVTKMTKSIILFSDTSILLNAEQDANDNWVNLNGEKLNYTNWGPGHPLQRDFLTLTVLKLV